MNFAKNVLREARKINKKIVFPESQDKRVLEAVSVLKKKNIVEPILIGNPLIIEQMAKKEGIGLPDVEVIYPEESDHLERFAKELCKLRKHKKMVISQARELMKDPVYYGAMLVHTGYADGLVSGATHPSKHTIKVGVQVLGIQEDVEIASSLFFMQFEKEFLIFADCAFMINPNAKQLSQIAIETIKTARDFTIEPRVAMLSYSTRGSGAGKEVDKVAKATKKVKEKDPNVIIDGELQFDAAYARSVLRKKAPGSPLAVKPANVFIFPDLNSGNIGYKIAQRLGGARAYGPILQGLKKPINDLSRGCTTKEIIVVAAITAIQADHILQRA